MDRDQEYGGTGTGAKAALLIVISQLICSVRNRTSRIVRVDKKNHWKSVKLLECPLP